MWIRLVGKLGGTHHGYFMPSEGTSNVALALFTFPSLAAYESYRTQAADDGQRDQHRELPDHQRLSYGGGTAGRQRTAFEHLRRTKAREHQRRIEPASAPVTAASPAIAATNAKSRA